MSADVAVDVVGVSKRFRLYHEKYQSLKERVLHAGNNPHEDFWALRDVEFTVYEGHTVGVIGRNGSGKSTLLKCVSGILQPTAGKVIVRGQLAALLELGAGFQPELSGRENIFLNASLLGISRRDIERRFDEIVAFAELGDVIENPVRTYSSGMYMRLAFSVAVHVDPEVMLIDEVLSVGDAPFVRKCEARMGELRRRGITMLLVSHDLSAIRRWCSEVVLLAGGRKIAEGDPDTVVARYLEDESA